MKATIEKQDSKGKSKAVLGIDLGGTDTKVIAFCPQTGEELIRETKPTRYELAEDGRPEWLHTIKNLISQLEEKTKRSIEQIGLCAPGFAAPDRLNLSTRCDST